MPDSGPILLVEDSAEDYEALTRALKRLGVHHPMYRFSHGETALEYLQRRGRFFKPGEAPTPGIVVLDLGLPGMSGREILCQIRGAPELRAIPVIILSGSSEPAEVGACHADGANDFIRKPPEVEKLAEVLRDAVNRWLVGAAAVSGRQ